MTGTVEPSLGVPSLETVQTTRTIDPVPSTCGLSLAEGGDVRSRWGRRLGVMVTLHDPYPRLPPGGLREVPWVLRRRPEQERDPVGVVHEQVVVVQRPVQVVVEMVDPPVPSTTPVPAPNPGSSTSLSLRTRLLPTPAKGSRTQGRLRVEKLDQLYWVFKDLVDSVYLM